MSHASPQPAQELLHRRKHRFIRASISLRDDLLERIDQLMDERIPYSSRSAVLAMLLTLGLQEWDRQQANTLTQPDSERA